MMDYLIQAMVIVLIITMPCLAYAAMYVVEWAKQDIRLRCEEANWRKRPARPGWADNQK